MKPPADGWDQDERDVVEMLDDELDAVRARHHADPPLTILRAARGDVLPEALLTTEVKSASESEWGRALTEGLDTVERPLTQEDEDRLLQRIRTAVGASRRETSRLAWLRWAAPIAAAAVVVVVVAVSRREPSPVSAPSDQKPAPADAVPAPRFVLPLDKPEVKLSAAVLTFRGAADDDFLEQLTKALDSFRADEYAEADRQLRVLEKQHPVFDVYFYEGLSRLLLNDAAGALPSLRKAASLADRAFASDVAWYSAVAEERAGHAKEARDLLAGLCGTTNAQSQKACEAQKQLESTLPVRPPS
jgi:hypothetical protein